MKVLVIGNGGREHALAWKLTQSPKVQRVYVAPGNGGTALDNRLHNVAITDFNALADYALAEKIVLTVVGPEAPLVAGLVDGLEAAGVLAFGPTAAAARIEGSKAFAKEVMVAAGIPTADYATFTEPAGALAWARQRGGQVVVKADGLAAGKGVVVRPSQWRAWSRSGSGVSTSEPARGASTVAGVANMPGTLRRHARPGNKVSFRSHAHPRRRCGRP